MNENNIILFAHIKKAGGTTLSGIINRQYKKSHCYTFREKKRDTFLALSQEKRDRIKIMDGHQIFGFHKYFTKKAIYISFLREPVDRVISDYFHEKKLLRYKKIKNYSLKDYVQSNDFPDMENRQLRVLSGNLGIPHGTCTVDMLNSVIKNIDEQFIFAGVCDYYDEFLVMLMLKFGWRYPFYKKINITRNKPHKTEIDEETIQVIEKYNQLDIELYRYMKNKFEAHLQQMDPEFYRKLETFKKWNKIAAPFIHPFIRIALNMRNTFS